MKATSTTIAAMIAITGLILSGAEAESIINQFAICSTGLALFASGLWWIAQIHRGE